MRPISRIIIHCTATRSGQNVNAKIIDGWHRNQGYKKIGYHYVILEDGTIEKGRDEADVGAHCLGYNNGSIGICYCGGIDANGKACDSRTQAQKRALRELVRQLCEKYPIKDIAGHNEFSCKACPCFDVKKEFKL